MNVYGRPSGWDTMNGGGGSGGGGGCGGIGGDDGRWTVEERLRRLSNEC